MEITITTHEKDELIDITDEIEEVLEDQDVENGVCTIFVKHSTCCLTTADMEEGMEEDFLGALRAMAPKLDYIHPHDPSHAPDHILSSIIGTSLTIPFEKKQLVLGVWQQVVLVELNGPRDRTLHITVVASA